MNKRLLSILNFNHLFKKKSITAFILQMWNKKKAQWLALDLWKFYCFSIDSFFVIWSNHVAQTHPECRFHVSQGSYLYQLGDCSEQWPWRGNTHSTSTMNKGWRKGWGLQGWEVNIRLRIKEGETRWCSLEWGMRRKWWTVRVEGERGATCGLVWRGWRNNAMS